MVKREGDGTTAGRNDREAGQSPDPAELISEGKADAARLGPSRDGRPAGDCLPALLRRLTGQGAAQMSPDTTEQVTAGTAGAPEAAQREP